jgi:hypothetical protein
MMNQSDWLGIFEQSGWTNQLKVIGLDKLSRFDQVLFACLIFLSSQMTNNYARNDLVG